MAFPSLNDYKRCIDKNDVKRNAGDDAPEAEYQAPVLYNASTKFVKSKLQKAVDALKSVPDDVPLKKLPDSIRNDVSIEILKAERSILVSFESDEAPAPYQQKKHCNVNSKRFLYGFYPSKWLSQAPVFFLFAAFSA